MYYECGVDPEVKTSIQNMVNWLRKKYVFPIRIHVYVKKGLLIKARDGDMVEDLFFWPDCRDDEPYIKIATGDYFEYVDEVGKDEAILPILRSLLQELTHYFQWLNGMEFNSDTLPRQARRYAIKILDEYLEQHGTGDGSLCRNEKSDN